MAQKLNLLYKYGNLLYILFNEITGYNVPFHAFWPFLPCFASFCNIQMLIHNQTLLSTVWNVFKKHTGLNSVIQGLFGIW